MAPEMQPRLDSLLLTTDELRSARSKVHEMAYFKWQTAGCPDGCDLTFWLEAELEWIKYLYIPDRYTGGQ